MLLSQTFQSQVALLQKIVAASSASSLPTFVHNIPQLPTLLPTPSATIPTFHPAPSSALSSALPPSAPSTSDTLLRDTRFSLPSELEVAILEAYDSGFTDTRLVSKYLEIRGLAVPSAAQIAGLLSRERCSRGQSPVSMLQLQRTVV